MASETRSATLDQVPARSMEGDVAVLAETQAFLVLESNRHTKRCGARVNEHHVKLLRAPSKGGPAGPAYRLVVEPRPSDTTGRHQSLTIELDSSTTISPALKAVRQRQTHFIKPDAESLLASVNTLSGEEIKLYCFEVERGSRVPLLNLLGIGRQRARLGFRDVREALGWFLYVAAAATLLNERDPDLAKVVKSQSGLAEHAAATHALMLDMD